jgi:2-keto-4-pentenoate hydratase/2-oxohepta-3-ene-1,7-dioic acid hydratase in catechol pathway
MRLANLAGRATIVTDHGLIDVAKASDGAFSASIDKCIGQLGLLRRWFEGSQPQSTDARTAGQLIGDPTLGPVVSAPQQIFAIGLNYRQHALEMGLAIPEQPMVFTKFVSSLCGPNDPLPVPGPTTDFEAELVVVMGKTARNVSVDDALSVVAGYCVGEDYSERTQQMKGSPAQFSIGKSFRNFAPIGPWLTTTDEVCNPNDLTISSEVNGSRHQDSNTSDMVFTIAQLVSYVSSICEIRPGDLMFTGSPHGVGQGQTPPVFISPGDVIVTSIEGLGSIRNVAVAP